MEKCEKVTYPTKQEARKVKQWFRKKCHIDARFYQCPTCSKWHITTQRNSLKIQFKTLDRQQRFRLAILSNKAEFLRRLSKKRTVWRVILGGRGFIVTYNKKSKLCQINSYFNIN